MAGWDIFVSHSIEITTETFFLKKENETSNPSTQDGFSKLGDISPLTLFCFVWLPVSYPWQHYRGGASASQMDELC